MSAGPEPRAAARGFTLIELVVTIALIAILMSLAAPSFIAFQRNSQLTGTANSFIASMAMARAEAMKRNRNAYVWPGSPGVTCSAGWMCGWFVFIDMDKSGDYSSGDLVMAQQEAPPTVLSTPANTGVSQFRDSTGQYVMYNGSGFPKQSNGSMRAAQSLDFAYGTTTGGSTVRRVISSSTGRMWVCTPPAGGCDATGN